MNEEKFRRLVKPGYILLLTINLITYFFKILLTNMSQIFMDEYIGALLLYKTILNKYCGYMYVNIDEKHLVYIGLLHFHFTTYN